MTTKAFLKEIELARFLGGDNLKKRITEDLFISFEKTEGGYIFTLGDDRNLYDVNTAAGQIRKTATYKNSETGYTPVKEKPEPISKLLKDALTGIGDSMTNRDSTQLYTLQEVANILKVSRQTIYNYVTAKKLRATKYGKEYRVTEADLQEFIKNGRNI